MHRLGEALGGRRAHAARRGVGTLVAVLPLEGLELAVEPVVLRVGDLGGVLDVVEPVVAHELFDEVVDARPGIGLGGGHARMLVDSPAARARYQASVLESA